MRAALALLAAVTVQGCATPAGAQSSPNPLAQFQVREGRLFDTGWQLARANRAFCDRTERSIGLLIHDAANYARADDVRRALSLAGDIGVQAVASGSPADRAGITPNRTLFALDLVQIAARWKPTKPSVERTLQIEQAMAESLKDGRVGLSFNDRGGETMLEGVEVCAATFRLTGKDDIYAGPSTVFFGSEFMGFGLDRDAFAAAVAHELAHVLLDHPQRKEDEKWGRRTTRESERIADRMMPWLLWNAGYDPRGAERFMQAWGPKHSGGLLRKRTHDGWDERLAMIVAERARLEDAIAANNWQTGEADWAAHFARKP